MKNITLLLTFALFCSFTTTSKGTHYSKFTTITSIESSITFINDSKEKITIHTGTGIVSLNKGSKTSIGCNVGKEVCWAENGKKGEIIFKITAEMCGKTFKLSEFAK